MSPAPVASARPVGPGLRVLVPGAPVDAVVELAARSAESLSGLNVSHITASSEVSWMPERLLGEPRLRARAAGRTDGA